MTMPRFEPECLSLIDAYSGHKDPQAWLNHLHAVAELYQWDETLCIKVGVLQFRGAARLWARRHQFTDWVDFCQQLNKRFGETTESAAARLEQCFQQHGESPRAFADKFLCCALRAGRCQDPPLLYSFIQRLLPDLRQEAVRQRLHSIAEVVAFCEYWLTAQGDNDSWQQYDDLGPDQQSWQQPSHRGCDTDTAAFEGQEDTLHPFHMGSAAVDSTYLLSYMCDSLEHQLSHMQERLHAQDLEICALKAAIAEQDLQRHKLQQQQQSSVHVSYAPCTPLDVRGDCCGSTLLLCTPVADVSPAGLPVADPAAQKYKVCPPIVVVHPTPPCGVDCCSKQLLCTHVADASVAGLPVADLAAQQPNMCHPTNDVHPSPTCYVAPNCAPASCRITPSYTSGCAPPSEPAPGDNSSNLAQETPWTNTTLGPSHLQEDATTQDDPTLIDKPYGYEQLIPLHGMAHKPPHFDYDILVWLGPPKATSPLLQETHALSPACIQDSGGTTTWLRMAPKTPTGYIRHSMLSGHLQHMLTWSKLPKDPGKLFYYPKAYAADLAYLTMLP